MVIMQWWFCKHFWVPIVKGHRDGWFDTLVKLFSGLTPFTNSNMYHILLNMTFGQILNKASMEDGGCLLSLSPPSPQPHLSPKILLIWLIERREPQYLLVHLLYMYHLIGFSLCQEAYSIPFYRWGNQGSKYVTAPDNLISKRLHGI